MTGREGVQATMEGEKRHTHNAAVLAARPDQVYDERVGASRPGEDYLFSVYESVLWRGERPRVSGKALTAVAEKGLPTHRSVDVEVGSPSWDSQECEEREEM